MRINIDVLDQNQGTRIRTAGKSKFDIWKNNCVCMHLAYYLTEEKINSNPCVVHVSHCPYFNMSQFIHIFFHIIYICNMQNKKCLSQGRQSSCEHFGNMYRFWIDFPRGLHNFFRKLHFMGKITGIYFYPLFRQRGFISFAKTTWWYEEERLCMGWLVGCSTIAIHFEVSCKRQNPLWKWQGKARYILQDLIVLW